MKKFSVIIPAYRGATLATAIESILQQTWTSWELVVVGQGRADSVEKVMEKYHTDRRVRYLSIERYGTCRARNAGIQASDGELIALIDDDCKAGPSLLQTFTDIFDDYPDVGLVGGALVSPEKPKPGLAVCPAVIPSEAIYDPNLTPFHPPEGWDWVGCSVAMRRDIYLNAGPLDEHLGPGTDFPAGEDTDYKLRLEKLGIKMAPTPRAVVIHENGYRYGIKAVMRNSRNYAYGNSGLAGKLTLLGDPRGVEWMKVVKEECLSGSFPRIHRLPVNLYRLYNSYVAYSKCLRNYRIQDGLLLPKA
jgi:glycosyltransferase involved in cell wall biosynthesis